MSTELDRPSSSEVEAVQVMRANRLHYEKTYGSISVDGIAQKLQHVESFLQDAVRTDTSWHGLYLNSFASRLKNARVLELGAGRGLNALVMAHLGADVVAVDISEESTSIISTLARRLGYPNVRPICGDFRRLSFGLRSFDFVVGKCFLHHLTTELEEEYLAKAALVIKRGGEARFFEPAVNSRLLDRIRWMVPVPGRPSVLSRRTFARWKEQDPHPDRNCSSSHFRRVGRKYFGDVQITPVGCIERFCRILPNGEINRRYRRWAFRIENHLPGAVQYRCARSQLIVYSQPHIEAAA